MLTFLCGSYYTFIGTHCSELQYYSPSKCKCIRSGCKGPTFSFKLNLPNRDGFPHSLLFVTHHLFSCSPHYFSKKDGFPLVPPLLGLFSLSIHCFFIFMSHPGSETWPQTAWVHWEWLCLKCNLWLFLKWTGWSIEMFLVISFMPILRWYCLGLWSPFLYSDHPTLNLPLILLSSILGSGESFCRYILKTPLFIHPPFYFINWPQD